MLDRDLAQRLRRPGAPRPERCRDDGELGNADAHAERRHERDPGCARRKVARHHAAVLEHVEDRVGKRPAGGEPKPAGDQRDDQGLGSDQTAHLAGRGAERAQHRRLAASLGDRERERAGHDEQRDRAGDAPHGPEDRDQRLAFRDSRVAGIGVCRVRRIEHLEAQALAQPFADRLRIAVGDHADRVDLIGRAGQLARGRRREEDSGVTELAGGGGDAADAERPLAAGRRDAELRADAGAEPRVDDDVGGIRGTAAVAQHVRRELRRRPVVAVDALARGARRERDVADRKGDAGHSGGAIDRCGIESRAGDGVNRSEVTGEPHAGIGAYDGVGGGEAARPRRLERSGHQEPGRVGERDREPDRDQCASERRSAGRQGLQGDAQHVSLPIR